MKKRRKGRVREFEKEMSRRSAPDSRQERTAAVRRKRIRLNKGRIALTVIVIVLIAVLGMSIKNVFSLRAEQKELEQKNKELNTEKEALQEELKNVNELEYIEEQARIQLKLIKPGEILYILEDEDKNDSKEED
ncbi:MAG: septum formation initiator family protein [Emergencia sp.]